MRPPRKLRAGSAFRGARCALARSSGCSLRAGSVFRVLAAFWLGLSPRSLRSGSAFRRARCVPVRSSAALAAFWLGLPPRTLRAGSVFRGARFESPAECDRPFVAAERQIRRTGNEIPLTTRR